MGEMIRFPANGGSCPGYLAEPGLEGAPGVVVLQEYWGLNPNIEGVADRLAGEGYLALAPDLYRGEVTEEPDEARRLVMQLDMTETEKDLRGALSRLRELTGRPAGVMGFCLGGALSLFAACANPDSVGACVTFYGIPLATHGYPALLERLQAPVLGFFAEDDEHVPPANVRDLERHLSRLDKDHGLTTYPHTRHGFFNDTNLEAYSPWAAGDAWTKTLAFFGRHL
jgi:carboxymethylenebutenolidase